MVVCTVAVVVIYSIPPTTPTTRPPVPPPPPPAFCTQRRSLALIPLPAAVGRVALSKPSRTAVRRTRYWCMEDLRRPPRRVECTGASGLRGWLAVLRRLRLPPWAVSQPGVAVAVAQPAVPSTVPVAWGAAWGVGWAAYRRCRRPQPSRMAGLVVLTPPATVSATASRQPSAVRVASAHPRRRLRLRKAPRVVVAVFPAAAVAPTRPPHSARSLPHSFRRRPRPPQGTLPLPWQVWAVVVVLVYLAPRVLVLVHIQPPSPRVGLGARWIARRWHRWLPRQRRLLQARRRPGRQRSPPRRPLGLGALGQGGAAVVVGHRRPGLSPGAPRQSTPSSPRGLPHAPAAAMGAPVGAVWVWVAVHVAVLPLRRRGSLLWPPPSPRPLPPPPYTLRPRHLQPPSPAAPLAETVAVVALLLTWQPSPARPPRRPRSPSPHPVPPTRLRQGSRMGREQQQQLVAQSRSHRHTPWQRHPRRLTHQQQPQHQHHQYHPLVPSGRPTAALVGLSQAALELLPRELAPMAAWGP